MAISPQAGLSISRCFAGIRRTGGEMADALALGASAARRVGSSPTPSTKIILLFFCVFRGMLRAPRAILYS